MFFSKFSTLLLLLCSNVAVVSGSTSLLRRAQQVEGSPQNSELCPTTKVPNFGDRCQNEGITCQYGPIPCKGETLYVTHCECSQSLDFVILDEGSELQFQCFTMGLSIEQCQEGGESDSPDIGLPNPPDEKPPKKECPAEAPIGMEMKCSVNTPTPCEYNPYRCEGEDIEYHDTHCYCENGKFECVVSRPFCASDRSKKHCTKEIKFCPDGTPIGRDSENNCEFQPCPDVDIHCQSDVKKCGDGTYVERDIKNNCEFKPCPVDDVRCQSDVKKCGDGTYMERDPKNDCEFAPCDDESPGECPESLPLSGVDSCTPLLRCKYDKHKCPGETTYRYLTHCDCGKDGKFHCAMQDMMCEKPICTDDMHECPDGSLLSRNPDDCSFPDCPSIQSDDDDKLMCALDTLKCPDGSSVGRDEDNDCDFHPCPGTTNCIECTDNLPEKQRKKGKECAKFNDRQIKKRCNKPKYKKAKWCQYSCFEAGFGYVNGICCTRKNK